MVSENLRFLLGSSILLYTMDTSRMSNFVMFQCSMRLQLADADQFASFMHSLHHSGSLHQLTKLRGIIQVSFSLLLYGYVIPQQSIYEVR